MVDVARKLLKRIKEKISYYTTPQRVRLWLLWGVLPTFATLVLLVFGDMWVGYTFIQAISNHFLDFCLTTFTLAVSIFSAAISHERNIEYNYRVAAIGAAAAWGIICLVIFCFLYYRNLLIEKGIEDMTPPLLVKMVHSFFIIIALLVIRTGIMLEKRTNS